MEKVSDVRHERFLFTILDPFLSLGSWQVKMYEHSKEEATFLTQYGTYLFQVESYGLTNASLASRWMRDAVLKDVSYTQVFIDDVVNFSSLMQDHFWHLLQVMSWIAVNELKIEWSNWCFAQFKIRLIRYVGSSNGTHVVFNTINVIKNTTNPAWKTELISSLCLYE